MDFEDFVKVITDRTKSFEKESKRKKMEVFRKISNKKSTLSKEQLEKSFYDHGFAITKEEVSEIYSLLEEKSKGEKIDFKNFDKILLEMT